MSGLLIKRRAGESVVITTEQGTRIMVNVLDIDKNGSWVWMQFDAPKHIVMDRLEMDREKQDKAKQAAAKET
jgi:carbon storage regulator CsrA